MLIIRYLMGMACLPLLVCYSSTRTAKHLANRFWNPLCGPFLSNASLVTLSREERKRQGSENISTMHNRQRHTK